MLIHQRYDTAITFTNVVFPEYCKPTRVNSISSFQNKLLNQSRIRLTKANISEFFKEKCKPNNREHPDIV